MKATFRMKMSITCFQGKKSLEINSRFKGLKTPTEANILLQVILLMCRNEPIKSFSLLSLRVKNCTFYNLLLQNNEDLED
jgi:hypothetical protein